MPIRGFPSDFPQPTFPFVYERSFASRNNAEKFFQCEVEFETHNRSAAKVYISACVGGRASVQLSSGCYGLTQFDMLSVIEVLRWAHEVMRSVDQTHGFA
jgi:hypothetical protein